MPAQLQAWFYFFFGLQNRFCVRMYDLPFTLDQLPVYRAIVSEGRFNKFTGRLFVIQSVVRLLIKSAGSWLGLPSTGRYQHFVHTILLGVKQ